MNKCEICNKNNEPVSKYAFEEAVTKLELANRRAWILNLVLVILLVTSLCYTMWQRSQFEAVETSYEIEQETNDGGDNYAIGRDFYGSPKGQGQD